MKKHENDEDKKKEEWKRTISLLGNNSYYCVKIA